MDQLSSCYFCGGALDVSLSEYPVVPKALQTEDDDPTTVVLCQTCRKKVGTIVERVVAATDPESPAADQSFEGTGFEPNEPEEPVTEEPLFEERAGDGPVTSDGSDASEASAAEIVDGETDGEADAEPQSEAESDPETTGQSSTDAESATEAAAESETGDEEEGEDEHEDDDGPSLSRLEYNKVMRLLKNREFPVDKMEIRDVATSAYQISPEEFDAVIEAAIDRDLLDEENGQFVDPS